MIVTQQLSMSMFHIMRHMAKNSKALWCSVASSQPFLLIGQHSVIWITKKWALAMLITFTTLQKHQEKNSSCQAQQKAVALP